MREQDIKLKTDEVHLREGAPEQAPADLPAVYKKSRKIKKAANKDLTFGRWVMKMSLLVLLTILFHFVLGNYQASLSLAIAQTLPLSVGWCWTMLRLNDRAAEKFGKHPVSFISIFLIATLSALMAPTFADFHFISHWADPSFWIWLVTQSAFYVSMGRAIEAHEGKPNSWKLGGALALCANFYLLVSLIQPLLMSAPIVFGISWFMCQMPALAFIFKALNTKTAKESQRAAQYPQAEGTDTIVRYRVFGAFERWVSDRFAPGPTKTDTTKSLFKWFAAPISIFALVALMGMTQLKLPDAIPAAPEQTKVFDADSVVSYITEADTKAKTSNAASDANMNLMLSIMSGFMVAFGGGILFYFSKPGYLALNRDGVRFRWRNPLIRREGKTVKWNDIAYIDLVTTGKGASKILRLKRADGSNVDLQLDAIDSSAEREAILNAIKTFAPLVQRDAQVVETLQPAVDHSYTELWMQALTAPPQRERLQPLVAGSSLQDGKYDVIRSIGVGGQGQAYLAKNRDGHEVVLKEFILPVFVDVNVRKNALEQFQNEAQILRQLDCPNIVKLEEYFVEDHRAYLVLEHIDGASLRTMVEQQGKMPEEKVRKLAEQMCEMLHYLHHLSPPVVHRDFTPDNLILSKDGKLKLIDFNVAKQIADSTAVGTVVGKHAYLPPEQFRGEPVPASDIYAMGCTLQYLLTGKDPEPVSVSSPGGPLDSVVRKATALTTENRYADIDDLASDLKAVHD